MKKIVLLAFVLVLLLPMTVVIHFSAPVKAEAKTWTVDDDGPADFHTVREAINAASPGDTVFVYNGTYQEWNLVLDKNNLSFIGENKDNTIIDGMNHGWILIITAQNVTVTGFTIQKSPIGTAGVFLNNVTKSKISNNIIKNHDSGIYSVFSNGNVIENNRVSDNYAGIILSSFCRENRISNNEVINNTVRASARGIYLSNHAHQNEVRNNKIVQNAYGVAISLGNNSILGNQIINNDVGIYERGGTQGYRIFRNNLINNTKQVNFGNQSVNIWDNGLEGNYWSNYNGTDFNQDGIGDTSYIINGNNTDHYPLMGTFSEFPVTLEEETYNVTTICNSTISAFQFDQVNKIIRFNVTGEEGIGFCRVCIAYDLMEPPYTATVDGHSPQYANYTLYDNGTHRWVYLTYLHSTHEIEITPEIPPPPLFWLQWWFWAIIAVGIVVLAVAFYFLKKRKPPTPTAPPLPPEATSRNMHCSYSCRSHLQTQTTQNTNSLNSYLPSLLYIIVNI